MTDTKHQKPLKIFISGFGYPECAKIVQQLRSDPRVQIPYWLGNFKGADQTFTSLLKGEVAYTLPHSRIDLELYQKVLEQFPTFIDMINRRLMAQLWPQDHYDFYHLGHLWLYYFISLIQKHRPDAILFSNIPHIGIDYLLYLLAKALNIPTLMYYQSLFPNRFFYLWDMHDFSPALNKPLENPDESLQQRVSCQKKEPLFYMQPGYRAPLRPAFYEKGYLKFRVNYLLKAGLRSLRFSTMLKRLERLAVSELGIIKYRHRQLKNYKRQWAVLVERDRASMDLNQPFVYFPLHLQPELTTSALGGVYNDQLLALEHLSQWIPAGMTILVKENPKQIAFNRGESFFQRLSHIPNLQFVAPETNTFDLIDHCQFVATITGTAGWEALKQGKPSLVFGHAWYASLPGVFQFSPELDIHDVLNTRIHEEHLMREVNLMVAKLPQGIIYDHYIPLVPDFDGEKNAQQIAELTISLLQEAVASARCQTPEAIPCAI